MDDYSIVVWTKDSDSKIGRLAEELIKESEYAHCYFDPQNPRNPHVFLALCNDSAIGFILMDLRYHTHLAPLNQVDGVGIFTWQKVTPELIWSTVCIWVKPQFRERGIGKELCLAGCSFFKTSPKELGWTTPITESGQAFLKALGINEVKIA